MSSGFGLRKGLGGSTVPETGKRADLPCFEIGEKYVSHGQKVRGCSAASRD